MSEALYHKALVERARTAFGKGRLPDPTSSATVDNPLCGDRVTLDLSIKDGRIAEIAHHVRGCLLCQASAAALASTVCSFCSFAVTLRLSRLTTATTENLAPAGFQHLVQPQA